MVLPDTQYYAASFPDIFMKQTSWIVENRDAQQIAFVLHTGDIVDSDVPAQWTVASNSLHMLDGVVPYVIAAGNHDYAELAWIAWAWRTPTSRPRDSPPTPGSATPSRPGTSRTASA